MLQDMQKELEVEQENEKELFEKAMCACETGAKDMQKVIDESTASIDDLTSQLEEENAKKSANDEELKNHYSGRDAAKGDLEKATTLRTKESTEFSKDSSITKSQIGQLNGAIPQLEGGASGASFMQQEDSPRFRRVIEISRYLNPNSREKVLNFLDDGLGESTGQPTAGTAEIIGILKDMKDHMMADLKTMTADEQSAASGFSDLKAAKEQEITTATDAILAKEKRSGALALSISQNENGLDDAKDELADAQGYLSTLNEACEKKRKERDMRNKMRTDEIAALSEAVSILNEDDALDVFKKAVPSAALLSEKKKVADYDAFVQVDGMASRRAGFQKAEGLVAKLAKKHPSAQYHLLLAQLKAAEPEGTEKYAGAAAKVVTHMVDDMVHVLHDEDVEDEHKKDFCANETETTLNLQTEKQNLVESLKASIEEMSDEVSDLSSQIKVLEEEIATNDKEVFEASELRQKEHKEFQDNFATMDTAKRLLDKAATRLHKFYSPEMHAKKVKKVTDKALSDAGLSLAVKKMKASFDTVDESFVQKKMVLRHRERKVAPPVLPDTPGTYEKKESGGVLGLMNKMKEELTADMREAETDEKYSAKDYVRIMKEAKETRAQLVKTMKHKMAVKAETENKIVDAKAKQSLTLEELQNLALYLVQLHSECDFLMRNFENRHEGRVGEEVGLEDAKTIVTHEEPPSHGVVEQGFKEEHSAADVEEHFPEEGGHIHGEAPAPEE